MGKRRTRAQKIIAQLKRELGKQQVQPPPISATPEIEFVPEVKSAEPKIQTRPDKVNLYPYDVQLIKKDLFKTFYLSVLMFISIGLCYWYFTLR